MMCEFHESTCNGLGDIWWTDNPTYFSSIDGNYHVTAFRINSPENTGYGSVSIATPSKDTAHVPVDTSIKVLHTSGFMRTSGRV